MGTISSIDMVIKERKLQAERANRIGWMVEEAARSRKRTTESVARRRIAAWAAGLVATLAGALLVLPSH